MVCVERNCPVCEKVVVLGKKAFEIKLEMELACEECAVDIKGGHVTIKVEKCPLDDPVSNKGCPFHFALGCYMTAVVPGE